MRPVVEALGIPPAQRANLVDHPSISPAGAVVAYPASYGDSGIMSFLVNHDGVVYEKDLGEDSGKAASMSAFNPDSSWKIVKGI